MTKKILILSGSPRKQGNSDLLCDEFMRGALEAGHTVKKTVCKRKKWHIVRRVMLAVIQETAQSRMTWQKLWRK